MAEGWVLAAFKPKIQATVAEPAQRLPRPARLSLPDRLDASL
jgi:hypothetical protein